MHRLVVLVQKGLRPYILQKARTEVKTKETELNLLKLEGFKMSKIHPSSLWVSRT